MVHVGTYIEDDLDKEHDYVTYDFDPNVSYKAYLDLKMQERYKIDLNQCEKFENEHLTIYVPVNTYDEHKYMQEYITLQKCFFKQLITCSQKEVIQKI